MATIHYADPGYLAETGLITHVSLDGDELENVIHASLVASGAVSVDQKIVGAAEKTLQRQRGFVSRGLGSFVPTGNAIVQSAGHNGYTHKGERGRLGFQFNTRDSLLLSPGFLGSSSHVQVPMVSVTEREELDTEEFHVGNLPSFLMYNSGNNLFHEVGYDIASGQFTVLMETEGITPSDIEMLSGVQAHSKYLRQNGVYGGNMYGAVHDLKSEFGFSVLNTLFERFFSGMVGFSREVSPSKSLQRLQEHSFSRVEDLADLAEGVKHMSVDAAMPLINRFFLYKSFERSFSGSAIVGEITGDSQTMHLPYLPVKLYEGKK